MSHNVTENPIDGELSPIQIQVLGYLLEGMTVTTAAACAKVTRENVHRWKSKDRIFIAALNAGKRDLQEALNIRLYALAHRAVEQVERNFGSGITGDDRSYQVLKDMGLLNGKPPGTGCMIKKKSKVMGNASPPLSSKNEDEV